MAIKRPAKTSARYAAAEEAEDQEEFNPEEYMDDEEETPKPAARRRRPAPEPEEDEEPAKPRRRAKVAKADESDEEDPYEDEDPDEKPKRPTSLQAGWAAAKKAADEAPKGDYTNDFKLTPDGKLVKFLDQDGPFIVYNQHWIDKPPEEITKKRSFPCLKSFGKKCPLCDIGDVVKPKFCFTVVEVGEGVGQPEVLTAGPQLFDLLASKDSARTGPLHRNYYEVSRTGKGLKTTYNIEVVRKADLGEEWGLSDEEIEDIEHDLAGIEPLTEEAITVTEFKELREIARAIA